MSAGSYERYLLSKKTVDDRAFNRGVLEYVSTTLRRASRSAPVRVLEIGAGIGTMIARLVDWKVLTHADYTALDVDPAFLSNARDWLTNWGKNAGLKVSGDDERLHFRSNDVDLTVQFVVTEISEFLSSAATTHRFDCLIACAFLDLVELPATLERLFALLEPGSLYWFPINYDGDTIFSPDHAHDAAFMRVYNQSMDDRVRYGRPAGDSRTGRHLFQHLKTAGGTIAAAGASDWVVFSKDGRYEADEAHFLEGIIRTVDEELVQHADVSRGALAEWTQTRREQLERAELVYIAHQLDFAGRSRVSE